MQTGRRAWQCELSSIDTALLHRRRARGGAAISTATTADEAEIRALATALYERVDWAWMLDGGDTLRHGWRPESGFLPYRWEGYDEALILYLLALGSPTHPIEPRATRRGAATYQWKEIYGIELPATPGRSSSTRCRTSGSTSAASRTASCASTACDYFENSRRATLVQQQYAIRNPLGFAHYGECCWGITASDGPGPTTSRDRRRRSARSSTMSRAACPYGPDDGTIAPWAVVASLPFAPRSCCPRSPTDARHRTCRWPIRTASRRRSTRLPRPTGTPIGWVSPYHFGINEGPTVR